MTKQEEILKLINEYSAPEHSSSNYKIIGEEDFEELSIELVKKCDLAYFVKPLPTEFADWIADQDLYRYHDGWEIDGEKFDTDELYSEFLKCYPTWSANG